MMAAQVLCENFFNDGSMTQEIFNERMAIIAQQMDALRKGKTQEAA